MSRCRWRFPIDGFVWFQKFIIQHSLLDWNNKQVTTSLSIRTNIVVDPINFLFLQYSVSIYVKGLLNYKVGGFEAALVPTTQRICTFETSIFTLLVFSNDLSLLLNKFAKGSALQISQIKLYIKMINCQFIRVVCKLSLLFGKLDVKFTCNICEN